MNIQQLAKDILLAPFEKPAIEYPVTCEERCYEAASLLLEAHPHLFTHKNANELGAVIEAWIKRKDDNYEPSDRDMGL